MRKKYKFSIIAIVIVAFLTTAAIYLAHANIPVLEPKGTIGLQERNLMVFALLLSLVVVIPVFTLLFVFAWRYREGNPKKTKYSPEFDHSRILETIWWVIPTGIITVLSVVTWNSSHTLSPYQPIASKTPAITIQVVALDWKWLFIYPQQGIATVNYINMPVNTPIHFFLTSDSVMNSFWVPQLGGQIYAMPGMSTQLYLNATSDGTFNGESANISGKGFAGMTFKVHADSNSAFKRWVHSAQQSPKALTDRAYAALAKPSEYVPVSYYSIVVPDLYDTIVLKYMTPTSTTPNPSSNQGSSSNQMNMQGMEM